MGRSSDLGKIVAWRRRIRRFSRSGLTVAGFCDEEGVSTASFYRWRNLLADDRTSTRDAKATTTRTTGSATTCDADQSPVFQAVRVMQPDSRMSVRLPDGTRIEVPAERLDTVRAVLGELVRGVAMQDEAPSARRPSGQGESPC